MKKYERSLKKILNTYYENGHGFIKPKWIKSEVFDIPENIYTVLQAKQLIVVQPYIDGGFAVTPSALGITYFEAKKDKLIRFWIPTAISVASLIVSFIALFS
ncbi:MAG: hypothetical protein IJ435_03600 [Clostridia bacterium]|nr:hypothetical protein [Clostridia bacterium]